MIVYSDNSKTTNFEFINRVLMRYQKKIKLIPKQYIKHVRYAYKHQSIVKFMDRNSTICNRTEKQINHIMFKACKFILSDMNTL